MFRQILGLEKARYEHLDKFWTYESQIRCPDKFLKKLLNLGSIWTGINQKCPDRKSEILTFWDLGFQGIVLGPVHTQGPRSGFNITFKMLALNAFAQNSELRFSLLGILA